MGGGIYKGLLGCDDILVTMDTSLAQSSPPPVNETSYDSVNETMNEGSLQVVVNEESVDVVNETINEGSLQVVVNEESVDFNSYDEEILNNVSQSLLPQQEQLQQESYDAPDQIDKELLPQQNESIYNETYEEFYYSDVQEKCMVKTIQNLEEKFDNLEDKLFNQHVYTHELIKDLSEKLSKCSYNNADLTINIDFKKNIVTFIGDKEKFKYIVGKRGLTVRRLMSTRNVNITIPKYNEDSNEIVLKYKDITSMIACVVDIIPYFNNKSRLM